MKSNKLPCLIGLALFALAAITTRLSSQEQRKEHKREHRRYRVIDTGTLGGPTSSLGFEGERDINNPGILVSTAKTTLPDPFSSPNVTGAGAESPVGVIGPAREHVVQPDLTPGEMKELVRALLINRNRRFKELSPK